MSLLVYKGSWLTIGETLILGVLMGEVLASITSKSDHRTHNREEQMDKIIWVKIRDGEKVVIII